MIEKQVAYDAAAKAVNHLLDRIAEDEKVHYVVGFGTESFELLVTAQHLITGKPRWKIEAIAMGKTLPDVEEFTTLDLLPFCSKSGSSFRATMAKPFAIGLHTYASDGRLILQIPRRDLDEEVYGAPSPQRVMSEFERDKSINFEPLPPLPALPTETVICDECGDEELEGHPVWDIHCARCKGTGQMVPCFACVVGARVINGNYLQLVSTLPDVRFAHAAGDAAKALSFRFGKNGIGLLMPMNTKPENANFVLLAGGAR